MARQKLTIQGKEFPSKVALEREVKALRDRQPLDTPLSPEDTAFVAEVFRQLYPKADYDEKRLGAGLKALKVIYMMGGRCFQMHLLDGRVEEPSLRVCFANSLATPAATAYNALRAESFEDCCRPYRDAYFRRHANEWGLVPCELTGKLVASTGEECEVDHVAPDTFKAILDDFLRTRGLTLATLATREAPDGRGARIADPALSADWLAYHRGRAKLRVLARSAHVDLTREAQQAAQA